MHRVGEEDIREVMAEEKSRGRRRPMDAAARRRHQELLRIFGEALKLQTEREFIEAIRELGLTDDEEKLQKPLKIWRTYPGA